MPSQSSHLSALRKGGHVRRVYLSDLSGEPVFTAELSGGVDSKSALSLPVTALTGSASNVKRGMRVVVTDADGNPKGTTHIRAAGTISSTSLPVREFSLGQMAVRIGDVATVYDDSPLDDKLSAADETFAPDQEAYTDQFGTPRPLVGSGGHYVGWLADSSSVHTDGSASLNLDPSIGGPLTHLWASTGGAVSSSSATSPTIDFSGAGAGKYRVDHTVTAANTKSRQQSTRYRIHDANDPPFVGTEESPLASDPDFGWTYSIRVYDPDAWALRPLCLVAVWVDETIGGAHQSFGNKVASRSHIKAVGYLRRATSGWDGDEGRHYVTYDIVSPLQMLAELPGFSKVMERDQTPDSWSEVKSLSVQSAWLYLALYYTNVVEAGHDLVLDDGGMMGKNYPAFYLQKANPLDQWRELADAVDCRIVCDRTGRIECQQFQPYVALDDRDDLATTLTATEADIIDYSMDHDFKEPVETYRMRGITAGTSASGVDPLFFRWPASPALGNQSDIDEKTICEYGSGSFSEGAGRAARRGAWHNRTFMDNFGVKHHAPRMTLRQPGSYDVYDLYREWVKVNITDEPRAGDISSWRWFVESISAPWHDGTGDVELQLQAETNGYGAVDDTPPDEQDNGISDYTDPGDLYDPIPLTPPVGPGGLGKGVGTIATFWTDNHLRITHDWSTAEVSGGPTYDVDVDLTALTNWGTGTLNGFEGDAQSPFYINTGAAVNGWILKSTNVQRISDVFGTPTLGVAHTLPAGAGAARTMRSERSVPNWVIVTSHLPGVGTYASYTLDGDTWTDVLINSNYISGSAVTFAPPTVIVGQALGVAYTEAYTNIAVPSLATTDGYVTSDYGASWAPVSNPNITPGNTITPGMATSFASASGGKPVYFNKAVYNVITFIHEFHLYRADGSGAPVDISPVDSGQAFGAYSVRGVVVSDDNPDILYMVATINDDGDPTKPVLIAKTVNARAASPTFTILLRTTDAANLYFGLYLSGTNQLYLIGYAAVGYSADGGLTIENKTGSIITSAACVGLCGGPQA